MKKDLDLNNISVKWTNTNEKKDDLKKEVVSLIKSKNIVLPKRIFLLDKLYPTNFIKDSSGGMFGSKQYFDISSLGVTNAQDLANALNGKKWSEIDI